MGEMAQLAILAIYCMYHGYEIFSFFFPPKLENVKEVVPFLQVYVP
jgi:hypothetical protein